jgi:hypothetical protein
MWKRNWIFLISIIHKFILNVGMFWFNREVDPSVLINRQATTTTTKWIQYQLSPIKTFFVATLVLTHNQG